ncbi:hypothetical protein PFISCL1PPCAC_18201, partial [Pristionchus fissidentatus]
LLSLPQELLNEVISYVSYFDRIRSLNVTCKRLYNAQEATRRNVFGDVYVEMHVDSQTIEVRLLPFRSDRFVNASRKSYRGYNFKFSEQLNRIFIAATINRLILNGVGRGQWAEIESKVSSLFATSTYKELQIDHFCSEKFLKALTNRTNISEVKIIIEGKINTKLLSTLPRVAKVTMCQCGLWGDVEVRRYHQLQLSQSRIHIEGTCLFPHLIVSIFEGFCAKPGARVTTIQLPHNEWATHFIGYYQRKSCLCHKFIVETDKR